MPYNGHRPFPLPHFLNLASPEHFGPANLHTFATKRSKKKPISIKFVRSSRREKEDHGEIIKKQKKSETNSAPDFVISPSYDHQIRPATLLALRDSIVVSLLAAFAVGAA